MKRGPRRWGLLCPDGHGILLENPDWGDKVWCPANGHGGNGRFFTPAEVQEGYEVAGAGLTEAQERRLKAAGNEMRDAAAGVATEADAPKRKERKVAEAATEAKPRKGKDPRDCECGCGGQTKGGRFIPGHDAKLHARQKAEAKAAAAAAAAGGDPD